uniref:Uncharacterized protein n=1 Tax=Arion vulgaris TaxID=1028688 RepID=A0A0B6Z8Y9_9EUPU
MPSYDHPSMYSSQYMNYYLSGGSTITYSRGCETHFVQLDFQTGVSCSVPKNI